jgi:hypothetical protein
VIAGIEKRRVDRLVFPGQQIGHTSGEPAENLSLGVNHMPLFRHFLFTGYKALHHLLHETSRTQDNPLG